MSEAIERQIVKELREIKSTVGTMKKDVDMIKEMFSDIYVSESEKRDLAEALEMAKDSKLLSKEDVFG